MPLSLALGALSIYYTMTYSELKISPALIEFQHQGQQAAQDQPPTPMSMSIQSMLPVTAPARHARHLSTLNMLSLAVSSSGWAVADQQVEVASEGPGLYTLHNLDPRVVFDAALQISSMDGSIFFLDVQRAMVPFNQESSYISQSGYIAADGGSTPLWKAGITGVDQVVGIADTGLDYMHCFFYDSNVPVVMTDTYIASLTKTVALFESTSHRKIRQ